MEIKFKTRLIDGVQRHRNEAPPLVHVGLTHRFGWIQGRSDALKRVINFKKSGPQRKLTLEYVLEYLIIVNVHSDALISDLKPSGRQGPELFALKFEFFLALKRLAKKAQTR